MGGILYFYISAFFISFLICIPMGPVGLEVFHIALKKHYPQAISVAVGAAAGHGIWALSAFLGISPFISSRYMEASFFLFSAIVTGTLSFLAFKDARFILKTEEEFVVKIKRKRWALLKGLCLMLVNPLSIVTWIICLSFLRKLNIYIPLTLRYEVIFFIVVMLGVLSFYLLIIFITNKMKKLFSPEITAKTTRILAWLLSCICLYFLFLAIKIFFFNGRVITQLTGLL